MLILELEFTLEVMIRITHLISSLTKLLKITTSMESMTSMSAIWITRSSIVHPSVKLKLEWFFQQELELEEILLTIHLDQASQKNKEMRLKQKFPESSQNSRENLVENTIL